MSERTSYKDGAAVTIWSALGDTAIPVAADMVDTTDGAALATAPAYGRPRQWVVEITSTGASTITGSIWLCGWNGADWLQLAELNGGSNVVTTATLGYAEVLEDVGIYDYLGAYAAANTTGAGNVTMTITPIFETDG